MGLELVGEQQLMMLVTNTHAEARVAAFLLLLSHRMRERGYSDVEFQLRMSRADIGSYLGLTLETVSRTLSAFASRGWVDVRKKRIRVNSRQDLVETCEAGLPGIAGMFQGEEPARYGRR
jgi:CRP/FNR family transcriptional regulator